MITSFYVGVFPEGQGVQLGDGASEPMTPSLTAAFEEARNLVPDPLPTPPPQSCCSGGYAITLDYSNGEHAFYGPCDLPASMDTVLRLIWDAYLANRPWLRPTPTG